MSLVVALALQVAAATPPAPAPADIVVQGKRLDEAYRACLARQCTPLRDAQVTIALAERHVREGKYVVAKRTMAAGVRRNRKFAASDPKPVTALYEAYATVALHEGDIDVYRRAVANQVRTLRENLPDGDPAKSGASIALAEMWQHMGKADTAASVYTSAERRARAGGDASAALIAQLRRASLAAARRDMGAARRLLREASAEVSASHPELLPAVRVTALRIAAREADDKTVDRLLGEMGEAGLAQPTLIWSPPYALSNEAAARANARTFGDGNPLETRSGDLTTIQWADVGFWIAPDGRTRDAEVLRGLNQQGWVDGVVWQIGARRYTAVADPAGQGVYQVERFTNRGTYLVPTGSLVRRRGGPRALEVLDLTEAGSGATVGVPATR